MATKTINIDSLITDYAQDIADTAGFTSADYPATPAGLSALLTDVADGISPTDSVHDWLTDAAADLDALQRIDATDDQARTVLARVDSLLYDARTDLA